LILTPTITAIKQAHPDAQIWVMVRRGCEMILAGCPGITRILTVAAIEKHERRPGDLWRDIKVAWEVYTHAFTHKFDFVFELGDGNRGRRMARLAGSRRRFSVKPSDPYGERSARKAGFKISTFDWQTCHRIEKDFYTVSEFLPLPQPVPPLVFQREFAREWGPGRALKDFGVLQIGTRQGFNRWHREGWLEVGRGMLERFQNVVISCGPVAPEVEEAEWLRAELGERALTTEGRASWAEVAWLLYRAKLYVGPNTAAMHLAAACQCPVVTLFGPSIEDHWRPWRVPHRIVTSPGYIPANNAVERYAQVKKRTMDEIQARDVVAACDELRKEAGSAK
jgi:heptosyltransferase-3